MKTLIALVVATSTLAGCAAFTKPIEPGDDWRERGTRDYSMPRY
jgi:hypothetical protein